jgi:pimeloyl-ACP methyl ester carboxylesterase
MRLRLIATLVPLALLAAACGSDTATAPSVIKSDTVAPSGTGSTPATGDSSPGTAASGTAASGTAAPGTGGAGTISWSPYQGSSSLEKGTLKVPVDYKDPSKGDFTLSMVRHLAEKPSERIGTLLVNPGGPGAGGTFLAEQAQFIYGQDLLDKFDILAWDPRGTGQSTPFIDCTDDYDHFFDNSDITPDNAADRQQIIDLAKEFTDDCVTKNAKILDFVGTNNSAHDMDRIRQALGEQKISYFGFSYGSELGAAWATLYPSTVRAAVLDGASDPNADFLEGGLQQTKGFEDALDTFLKQCSAKTSCSFHNGGHAEQAFDSLMESIDATPIPTEEGRPDLTRGAALTGVSEAMYDSTSWPQLAVALSDAQAGNGAGLLALYDAYFMRQANGTYDNTLEAFNVISCMDDPTRITVAEDDASAPEFNKIAPRIAPGTTGSYQCTFFPPSTDPRVTITGKGAGPILVMGTTGDPATPLASTRNMAKALQDGRLVIVTADQHTG